MEIIKIVSIGLVGAFVFVYFKSMNSELTSLIAIATGIIVITLSLSYIVDTIEFFKEISTFSGIDSSIFVIILKITTISYLTEFSITLCEDLGVKSIGDKIALGGRLIIFAISIPIFRNLFELLFSIIK